MSESEPAAEHVVTVYSDYVCPFCHLGRASLERYREAADDPPAVRWHPFDLRGHKRGPDGEIDPDADDGKDEAYFERARRNVERLAERYDVEMAIERDRDVDSWNAQVLARHVQAEEDAETFAALDSAIFDAHWTQERDIGDVDVLVDLAREVGIEADRVRSVLDDEDEHAALESAFEAARRHGVTGVPTFVYDGHAARGAVPPDQIERLVEG